MKAIVEANLGAVKRDSAMKKERSASPGLKGKRELGKTLSLKVDMNKSVSQVKPRLMTLMPQASEGKGELIAEKSENGSKLSPQQEKEEEVRSADRA